MMTPSRVLFLFRSIHHVLAAEAALKTAGIRLDLIPVPKELSSTCGMAITVDPSDRARAVEAVAAAHPVRVLDDWKP